MRSQIKFGDRITIRQTIDPFADDIQYIKSWEVDFEPDGSLSMSKVRLGGKLGDNFVLITRDESHPDSSYNFPLVTEYRPTSDLFCGVLMQLMASFEDGPDPFFIVVESGDHASGFERHMRRIDAHKREKQIAYVKQLVTRPWNWVASIIPPIPYSPTMSIAVHNPDPIPILPTDLQPANATSTSVLDIANTSRLVHRQRTANTRHLNSSTG